MSTPPPLQKSHVQHEPVGWCNSQQQVSKKLKVVNHTTTAGQRPHSGPVTAEKARLR